MAKIYDKPPFTIEGLISKLQDKGLKISDKQEAEHFLNHVSYYRFTSYLLSYQDLSNGKTFLNDTTFKDVIQLYNFDSELRFLLSYAIEKIEISIRTCLLNKYSLIFGANWYEDSSIFEDETKHRVLLTKIDELLQKNNKEKFIKHYNQTYDTSKRPPCWIVFETFTLGTLSNMLSQIKTDHVKKDFALVFGLKAPHILESWLHTLTYIRNVVAHHSRLWNRELGIKPAIPKKTIGKWIDCNKISRNRLYLAISAIQYLLNSIAPTNDFGVQLKNLLGKYPSVNIKKMGFPLDWQKQPLWK